MGGCYFWLSSNLEKYGQFWKNGRFSGRIRPDWENTAQADMAGLGSIGLNFTFVVERCISNESLSHRRTAL